MDEIQLEKDKTRFKGHNYLLNRFQLMEIIKDIKTFLKIG